MTALRLSFFSFSVKECLLIILFLWLHFFFITFWVLEERTWQWNILVFLNCCLYVLLKGRLSSTLAIPDHLVLKNNCLLSLFQISTFLIRFICYVFPVTVLILFVLLTWLHDFCFLFFHISTGFECFLLLFAYIYIYMKFSWNICFYPHSCSDPLTPCSYLLVCFYSKWLWCHIDDFSQHWVLCLWIQYESIIKGLRWVVETWF